MLVAVSCGSHALAQVKGEASCRKFLQEDFFKRMNDWSLAACNPGGDNVATAYEAVVQAISVKKLTPISDEISAANKQGDGWLAFFQHLADVKKAFECRYIKANAVCASRTGVWMLVEFEVRYDNQKLVAHDYMCVQTFPFGSVVDQIRSNPPDNCEFDASTMFPVKAKVVDETGNPVLGYSVSVNNKYVQTASANVVVYRNENFSIEKVFPFSTIVVSRPGYETQELPASPAQTLEIIKLKKLPQKDVDIPFKIIDDRGQQLFDFHVAIKDTVQDASISQSFNYQKDVYTLESVPLGAILTFSKSGYEPASIPADSKTDVRIIRLKQLPRTTLRVTGRVVDELGNPLTYYDVQARDTSAKVAAYFVSYKNDVFEIGPVSLEAVVTISKTGYEDLEVPVRGRSDLGSVKLIKKPLTIIKVAGKVVDDIGNPLYNYTVEVKDQASDAGGSSPRVSYRNDVFSIDQVAVDASFTVSKLGYESISVDVSNRTDVGIIKLKKLPPQIIRVSGQVADELGIPLSNYTIQFNDSTKASGADFDISYRNNVFTIGKAPYDATITLSKPGYETRDVAINNRGDLGIVKLAKAPAPASSIPGSFTETVNGVPFNMVFVEGSTFQMGATEVQGDEANYWEKPVHQVTLGNFVIGQTEVTLRLWRAVMGKAPGNMKGIDTSRAADNLPVVNISWSEAQSFVQKLSSLTGRNYRLPTDAEWEYAARGGKFSKGYKYSGSNNVSDVAWCDANSGKKIQPVAKKSPNELGLYDMSGNVWVWCQDVYREYDAPDYTPAPRSDGAGDAHVYRGGGYGNESTYSRISYRHYLSPDYQNNSLGLRLAL